MKSKNTVTHSDLVKQITVQIVAAISSSSKTDGRVGPLMFSKNIIQQADSFAQLRKDVIDAVAAQMPDVAISSGLRETEAGGFLMDVITVEFKK